MPAIVGILTHISLASFYGTQANSADPDQMPQSVASDPVPDCLLTDCSIKFEKNNNTTLHPKSLKWTAPIDSSGKFESV